MPYNPEMVSRLHCHLKLAGIQYADGGVTVNVLAVFMVVSPNMRTCPHGRKQRGYALKKPDVVFPYVWPKTSTCVRLRQGGFPSSEAKPRCGVPVRMNKDTHMSHMVTRGQKVF
jgi:hypothetical protein